MEACGSLNAAAKKLGMSYRAAWGRVRASEQRLGISLIEKGSMKKAAPDGGGKSLLQQFEELEKRLNACIRATEEWFDKQRYVKK